MGTNNKYIRIYLLLLLFPLHLSAQQKVITLSDPVSASGSTVYEAQGTIYLNPGFSYTAKSGTSFEAKINESMVTPPDYITPVVVDNRTLNTGLSPGTIAGGAGVGETGAANYQVAISLPPGINGMQPTVSLVYNSQGGNGVAGWGFNIAGLSAVGRSPRNIYSDGTAEGVLTTSNAKYVLDGVSLIPVSGVNGADGTEYRTEMESFSKIYSRGSYNGTGPDWFEVKTKDGLVLKYGSAASGKLKSTSGTSTSYIQAWYLSRMENPDGVGVDYTYETAGMGLYIKKIAYSGNTVEFYYDTRRDTMAVYMGSKTGFQDRILRKIIVKCEGEMFRTYEFEYTFDRFSRLAKITESNGMNEKKNPTVFEWGSYPAKTNIDVKNITVEKSTLEPNFSKQFYTSVDLNGDGLSDIISYFPYEQPNGKEKECSSTAIQIYIAKKDGSNIKFELGNSNEIPSIIDSKKLKIKYGGFLTGDYFGEGIQNAILPAHNKENNKDSVKFYIFNDKSYRIIAQYLEFSSELPEVAVGDVDNDGKCELLYIEKKPSISIISVIPLSAQVTYTLKIGGDGKSAFKSFPLSITSSPERMIVADFNGNGMNDVMVITKDGYHIYWNQGGDFSNLFSASNKTVGTLFNSNYSEVAMGDFNGDGLPDFVLNEPHNDKWHLAINKGNGIFTKKLLPQITAIDESFTDKNNDKDRCFVMDFDGDGKSDIIINDSEYDSKGKFIIHKVYWYRSTGDDFELVKSTSHNTEDVKMQYFTFGDFKGTGNAQMLFYGYDCYNGKDHLSRKWRLYENAGFTAESGKIKGIADGMNNRTKFTYKPLTDPSVYTPANASTYPIASLRGPLYAVSEMTQTNGVAGNTQSKYTYRNGRIHLQGRGFLGFEQIKTTESLSNTTQIQDYGLDNTYYFPVLNKTSLLVGSDTVSTASYTGKVKVMSGKRIFPYTEKTIKKDFLNAVSISHTQVYNNDGNLTGDTVRYGNDVTEVRNMLYAHYGGNGIANKQTSVTLTRTYAGESPFVAKQQYNYDAKGHLIKTSQYDNTTNPLVTEYLNFTANGLPGKIKVSTKETARETSFVYDNRGRVTSRTNAIGQVFKTAYDKRGRITTQTSHLNLNTVHVYDSWDRETSVTRPDNTSSTQQFAWAGSGGDVPTGALYRSVSTVTGETSVTTYHDAAGRELRTLSYNAFNKKVYMDSQYDTKGQLVKTSLPYFPGDAVKWISYTYDSKGRLKTENNLSRITEYEYGALTTTVTAPDGEKTTKTTNAAGDVVTVVETGRGGLVLYAYHSSGQPRSVIANGSEFTMQYDSYGRQIKLTDPNAGTVQYTYNPFGELITQKDARGYTTSFKYDLLGRETERKVNSQTYTSTYNSCGIDSVKSGDKGFYYRYDSFGRLRSLTEKAGADSYTTGYTYNANGQLHTRTFPSGFALEYNYTNGVRTSIRRASDRALVWELTEENALGQITAYRKGGKFNIDLEYDAYFNPNNKRLDGLSYAARSINPKTGNLNSRSVSQRKETFEYDSQNRLTQWRYNTGVINQATYHDNGNIATKTGVGTYAYDTPLPHAVTGVAEQIASQNQEIIYNEQGRAKSIEDGNFRMTLDYGVNDQRIKTFLYEDGTLIKEKHYAAGYEKVIEGQTVREVHYINAPSGLTAIVVRSAGTDSLFHVYTDHQGSILQLTNETGVVVERRNYDPWGRERNPDNWDSFSFDSSYRRTDRGYTGHEHLPEFGLINMNARLYDPMLGRFLSPDPYVQAPDFSQNFNRYTYCLNNPLIYTDPSGEFFWIIPSISWSPNGGWNFGISAGVGPFYASIGYGKSSGFTATVGASGMGFNVYAGWNSQSGFIAGAGYGVGIGGYRDFSFNTNMSSIGINYSSKGGFSFDCLGAQYNRQTGWSINPSVGVSYMTGKGVYSISETEDLGVTTKDKASITTDGQLEAFLESKGVDYARDYYASVVSVENQIQNSIEGSSEVYNNYRRINGIIYRLKNGQPDKPVGGITASLLNWFKRPTSYIYVSTHGTADQLLLSLNHEFIHSWQWARFGHKNKNEWEKFADASAYRYTQLFLPSISAPSYLGTWWPYLYTWPKLPYLSPY